MSTFLENFSDKQSVLDAFQAPPDALKGARLLLAWYGYGSYCGSALVIFKRGGKLYEVNGSHCSCSGLEGQWDPEETSPDALLKRDFNGEYDGASEATMKLHALAKRLKRAA